VGLNSQKQKKNLRLICPSNPVKKISSKASTIAATRMPAMFMPHGGGPSFLMTGERKQMYRPTYFNRQDSRKERD
jgi:hypothetical protein